MAVVAIDGDVIEGADVDGRLFRVSLGDGTWADDGRAPSDGQSSIGTGWFVDGHLVVDTGSGGTNGRFVAYRQASGAWVTIGTPPYATNDDPPAVEVDGHLCSTNGRVIGVLRPIDDPTVGVPSCRAGELEVTTSTNADRGTPEIYLTNRSDHACTVSGQRPAEVRFVTSTSTSASSAGVVQPASAFLHQPQGTSGGIVPPGKWARIDVGPWTGPDGGTDCPARSPVDEVRFTLPDGDQVTAPIAAGGAPGCVDLSAIGAVDPATFAPGCRADVLRAVETFAGAAAGSGGITVSFTNTSTAPCSLVGQPTLEVQAADASWDVAAAPGGPGAVPNPSPPSANVEPGGSVEVRTWGTATSPYPDGRCPAPSPAETAPTGGSWRFTLPGGGIVSVTLDRLAYPCGARTSGFSRPAAPAG